MLFIVGCGKNEEQKIEGTAKQSQTPKKESVVVVPAIVKGKWKAVKIAVTDKNTQKKTLYTVDIGSQVSLPGSNLVVKVENFLPQFIIEGTHLTSQTNEPKNPAAQIIVMDGGKEIYKGWLFSLYPDTHKFEHPKFGFTLVDFIPAR